MREHLYLNCVVPECQITNKVNKEGDKRKHLRTFSTEKNRQKDGSVSANFVGNTLTQSEAIG